MSPSESPYDEARTPPPLSPEIIYVRPAEPQAKAVVQAPRPRIMLPLILFIATCWSTAATGGVEYAIALMSLLMAHEMGHFLQSVRYGVPASLPIFIPMPYTPIGTMGAVIVQRGGVADRKAMFDIAISGPLAGLVVALPVFIYGLTLSRVIPLPNNGGTLMFGEPLLVKWLIRQQFGVLAPGTDVALHPLAFAGWVGIFITALNLIPVGQLDGGHILFALLGRRAWTVARLLWGGAVLTVIGGTLLGHPEILSWTVMLVLLWSMGIEHPPTADDGVPLGTTRTVLGWLTLAFLIIGFTPFPMYEQPPQAQPNNIVAVERIEPSAG